MNDALETTADVVTPTDPETRSKWLWPTRICSLLGFLILIPLVGFAALRIFRLEDSTLVVLSGSFTPILFLPAYVVLAFAVTARRRILGCVALLLVVCHLTWTFPEYRPATLLPKAVASAPSFKVFSQNIRFDNQTPEAVAQTIRRNDADIVMFQELTQSAVGILTESGALAPYPYSTLEPERGPQGIGIWSKVPFDSTQIVRGTEFPAIRVTLRIHGRQIVVWSIHTQSPPVMGGAGKNWKSNLEYMRKRLHGETGDVVAAGDFNATYSHRPYREIVSNGYRDAHIDRGRGYARTWPNDIPRLAEYGGVIRIDHVLTRGSLRAKRIQETPALGSDHRGLVTEIAIL